MKKVRAVGRPPVLLDEDVLYIDGSRAAAILQEGSDRRAIINRVVELGGRASIEELNRSFGFDTRQRVLALMRQGWLGKADAKAAGARLPRRTKTMFHDA